VALTTNDEEEFLAFHPRNGRDTIYTMRAPIKAALTDVHASIYSLDYETMHRRLAHRSRDVLQRAGKHIKDFSLVQFPEKSAVCPGCEQGKMTNKPFPPSESRADKPFELVHSDLKSFPIASYQKYMYAIIFYDDCTSHAWMMNLRTKDAALMATKQFLAMVENKYNAKVKKLSGLKPTYLFSGGLVKDGAG
jgi:hypothetical protein